MEEIQFLETSTKEYYSQEVQIERKQLKELEKKAEVDLKENEGISTSVLRKALTLFRENIVYLGRYINEIPIEIKESNGEVGLSLINTEKINQKINKLPKNKQSKINYIHIGAVQIILKSTYGNIDTPIDLAVIDNRITSRNIDEKIIGRISGNLKYSVMKFNINLQHGIPLITNSLDESIAIMYKFHRQDLMNEGDHPFSITYAVNYALTNSHHSITFINKNKIEIDQLFEKTSTQLVTNQPVHPLIGNFRTAPRKSNATNLKPKYLEPSQIFTNQIVKQYKPPSLRISTEDIQEQLVELRQNIDELNNRI